MKIAIQGTVHGRTIWLDAESGLPDGQSVEITLEPKETVATQPSSSAFDVLRAAAGSWSDDPDGLDRYLEWNRQQRKQSGRNIE